MTTQTAGNKRKSTDGPDAQEPVDLSQYDIPDGSVMDSCNIVRGKIRRFLESGEMKVGQFCDTIGVSGNAYRRFMSQNGKEAGAYTDTYQAAWEFFKKREMAGLKMPTKKKQKTTDGAAAAKNPTPDLSQVIIDGELLSLERLACNGLIMSIGEKDDKVQVYETCDEVRKKINAYLRKPGVTQAQFCRDLVSSYQGQDKPSTLQSRSLTTFRGQKGPSKGNTSSVFFLAYCFFEKLRIYEKKPKSKFREEMENVWGSSGGFDIVNNSNNGYVYMKCSLACTVSRSAARYFTDAVADRYICLGSQRPYEDKYGSITVM